MARAPSPPPQIPGFTYERLLGSGGFADVFLYHQHLPRRPVAVKVMLASATGAGRRDQFVAEANVMAQLSAHPSIVTIYHADTAADGRPYLVMEYCPRPNLSERYRARPFGVGEALRVGIRLAGAVETAHRAGILHRDIKPANVLTTDYGWPALTDFGISVVHHGGHDTEAVGMSIPWSAPEFFNEHARTGIPGDVYALAATVYTLLAGRSPFEEAEGRNSALELIGRIEQNPLPPLGRGDAPPLLDQILAQGMAKDPGARFATAGEFGRALQRVEQELHLAQTSLDLPDTSGIEIPDAVGEELRTRVRSVAEITPAPAVPGPHDGPTYAGPPASDSEAEATTRGRAGADQPVTRAQLRGRAPKRWRVLTLAASVIVILAVGAVVIYGAMNAPEDLPKPTPTATTTPRAGSDAHRPEQPRDLTGHRDPDNPDEVTFTWAEAEGEVEYAWRLVPASGTDTERTAETEITLRDMPGHVCLEVATISAQSHRLSVWSQACA